MSILRLIGAVLLTGALFALLLGVLLLAAMGGLFAISVELIVLLWLVLRVVLPHWASPTGRLAAGLVVASIVLLADTVYAWVQCDEVDPCTGSGEAASTAWFVLVLLVGALGLALSFRLLKPIARSP